MALYPCRECGRPVSTEAPFCPQCGVPEPTRSAAAPEPPRAAVPQPPPAPVTRAEPTPARPASTDPWRPSPHNEKGPPAWKTPVLFAGGLLVLMGIAALLSSMGRASGGGYMATQATMQRTIDSTEAAGILARLDSATTADMMRLESIAHRWRLPHDPATHERAVTMLLDSASSTLRARGADRGATANGIIALLYKPLTPKQTERMTELQSRAEAHMRTAAREAEAAAARAASAAKWSYSTSTDEMTGRASKTATISSENTVNFDFPYQGAQHARLILRNHPSHGRDAIVAIERGQILCPSYDDCTLRIRFDDGKPESFTAAGAADHSSTTAFIRNYSRFVEKLRRAKVVRIQVPVYQEGRPSFEFRVGGFDHERYTRGQ